MKFKAIDARYFASRKEFSESYGPRELWSTIDQWPLYVGIGNLARCMAVAEMVKETLDVPGHVAEFGSWKGANLLFMAKLLRIYSPMCQKLVHCFDGFMGLTEFSSKDGTAAEHRGAYKGSYEELLDVIKLYEMEDEVIIHKGLIEKTLPALVESEKAMSFSLVYCDTDLYDSTSLILQSLHPRLMKGGMFVFDEWNADNYPGEGVAANEFLREFGEFYEVRAVKMARQPTMVIKKIK